MSILTKILMGLVVVAVLPVLFFASAVLKVNNTWRISTANFEKAVEQQEKQNFDILHGDDKARVQIYTPGKLADGKFGTRQLEIVRDNLKLGRGRFWYATPVVDSLDQATGKFKINMLDSDVENTTRQPQKEHGIKDRSFLYLFQANHDPQAPQDGARYLGEFVVEGLAVDENGVPTDGLLPLKPSQPLTAEQMTKLMANPGQWVAYEHMPIDDHDLFNDLSEDEIQARLQTQGLRPEIIAEYVNDNKTPSDAVLNDPKLKEFIVEDKDSGTVKFLRPLRDYQQIFRSLALRATEIDDRVAILRKEWEFAKAGEANAIALIASLDARQAKLLEEKKLLEVELVAVRAHAEKLDALLAKTQQELQARLSENKRMADEIMGLDQKTAAWQRSAEQTVALTP